MGRLAGLSLRLLRDPTRGGLAATLNEVAHQSSAGIVLEERAIPVHEAVAKDYELLGWIP
jgi:hydrogenase expression/formation protein HypE